MGRIRRSNGPQAPAGPQLEPLFLSPNNEAGNICRPEIQQTQDLDPFCHPPTTTTQAPHKTKGLASGFSLSPPWSVYDGSFTPQTLLSGNIQNYKSNQTSLKVLLLVINKLDLCFSPFGIIKNYVSIYQILDRQWYSLSKSQNCVT